MERTGGAMQEERFARLRGTPWRNAQPVSFKVSAKCRRWLNRDHGCQAVGLHAFSASIDI